MSRHRSKEEKMRILVELKRFGKSMSKFCREKGIAVSTLRGWRNTFGDDLGDFVKLEKDEGRSGLFKAENDEPTEETVKDEEMFGNDQNGCYRQSQVVIEYGGLKITADLEQSLKILEMYHDRIQ